MRRVSKVLCDESPMRKAAKEKAKKSRMKKMMEANARRKTGFMEGLLK